MGQKLAVDNVWVIAESGAESVLFSHGDTVPAWAAKQMGDHCFTAPDEDESPNLPPDPQDTPAEKPAGNASLEAWQDYALSQGATSSQVDGKTRAELREQFGS